MLLIILTSYVGFFFFIFASTPIFIVLIVKWIRLKKKYWSEKYKLLRLGSLYYMNLHVLEAEILMPSNIIQTAFFSYSIDKMYYVLILQTTNKKVNNRQSKWTMNFSRNSRSIAKGVKYSCFTVKGFFFIRWTEWSGGTNWL